MSENWHDSNKPKLKKIKPEDVASELRLLSKNWCLSPEVINIISHGYERICELEKEIAHLTAERDEARMEVCVWQGLDTGSTPRDTATVRGWDCFPQEDDK